MDLHVGRAAVSRLVAAAEHLADGIAVADLGGVIHIHVDRALRSASDVVAAVHLAGYRTRGNSHLHGAVNSGRVFGTPQATAVDRAVDGALDEGYIGMEVGIDRLGTAVHATQGRATIDVAVDDRRYAAVADIDIHVAAGGGSRTIAAAVDKDFSIRCVGTESTVFDIQGDVATHVAIQVATAIDTVVGFVVTTGDGAFFHGHRGISGYAGRFAAAEDPTDAAVGMAVVVNHRGVAFHLGRVAAAIHVLGDDSAIVSIAIIADGHLGIAGDHTLGGVIGIALAATKHAAAYLTVLDVHLGEHAFSIRRRISCQVAGAIHIADVPIASGIVLFNIDRDIT